MRATDDPPTVAVSAIVLAAGLSSRMGTFKPLLPFGKVTVIEHILHVLLGCSLSEVLLVTGHEQEAIEAAVRSLPVQTYYNAAYKQASMLSSIQIGLHAATASSSGALIVLGDQPSIRAEVITRLVTAFREQSASIVVPSYNMRRGHPILVGRSQWSVILDLPANTSLREYVRAQDDVFHVELDSPDVLRDMDTHADYVRELNKRE